MSLTVHRPMLSHRYRLEPPWRRGFWFDSSLIPKKCLWRCSHHPIVPKNIVGFPRTRTQRGVVNRRSCQPPLARGRSLFHGHQEASQPDTTTGSTNMLTTNLGQKPEPRSRNDHHLTQWHECVGHSERRVKCIPKCRIKTLNERQPAFPFNTSHSANKTDELGLTPWLCAWPLWPLWPLPSSASSTHSSGCGSKPKLPFWGWLPLLCLLCSLFQRFLDLLGYPPFDPQPNEQRQPISLSAHLEGRQRQYRCCKSSVGTLRKMFFVSFCWWYRRLHPPSKHDIPTTIHGILCLQQQTRAGILWWGGRANKVQDVYCAGWVGWFLSKITILFQENARSCWERTRWDVKHEF